LDRRCGRGRGCGHDGKEDGHAKAAGAGAVASAVTAPINALGRLRAGAPGNFGHSLFAVTQTELRRLRDTHLEYVRAMQSVIAASSPGQCAKRQSMAKKDRAG
jgi:hypothetical protein